MPAICMLESVPASLLRFIIPAHNRKFSEIIAKNAVCDYYNGEAALRRPEGRVRQMT